MVETGQWVLVESEKWRVKASGKIGGSDQSGALEAITQLAAAERASVASWENQLRNVEDGDRAVSQNQVCFQAGGVSLAQRGDTPVTRPSA